jgi:hypothetical protein
MNPFNNALAIDESSGSDNPFSDIYENAHDIFSSHDLPPLFNQIPSPLPIFSSPNTPLPSCQSQDLMSLLPECIFHSEEEVADTLQKWAIEHKFGFVKQRSQMKNKAGHEVILWACDRHGGPPLLPKHSNQLLRPSL